MEIIEKTEKTREIRFLGPEDVEEYLPIYFNSYPAFKNIGDEGHEIYLKKTLDTMEKYDDVHFVGLYEDDVLIATMKIIDFSMNVFGQIKPAAGLMALGVDPLHKKAGAALEMVKYFERYVEENKMLLALLLPFRADFYRKMGYGFETRLHQYHLPMEGLPICKDVSKLRFLGKEDFEKVFACYSRAVLKTHGMIEKLGEEKRDIKQDSESRRVGYFQEEELLGYVTYRCVCDRDDNYTINHLDVSEIIYESPQVLKSLLGYLRLQQDQAQTVIIRTGEEDFYHILDNPQDVSNNYIDFGYLQTNTASIGIMHKIISPSLFIKETEHRQFPPFELTLKIEYQETFAKEENSVCISFVKDEKGQFSRWKVVENTELNDVAMKCKMGDMASIFMGSCSVSALERMGAVWISDKSYIKILEQLFHVEQRPWSNTDF